MSIAPVFSCSNVTRDSPLVRLWDAKWCEQGTKQCFNMVLTHLDCDIHAVLDSLRQHRVSFHDVRARGIFWRCTLMARMDGDTLARVVRQEFDAVGADMDILIKNGHTTWDVKRRGSREPPAKKLLTTLQ